MSLFDDRVYIRAQKCISTDEPYAPKKGTNVA